LPTEIESGASAVHASVLAGVAPAGHTHVRHKVLAMTMALGAITYLDRVSISIARPDIARDLGLSPTQMGYVFSAFYVAYALFEIPTGWWGDRVGTRRVLTRIVCWWSTFTVLTGFAFNYSSLVAIRFLFGAGEAGASSFTSCQGHRNGALTGWQAVLEGGGRTSPALRNRSCRCILPSARPNRRVSAWMCGCCCSMRAGHLRTSW
jgi:hypothetical protein